MAAKSELLANKLNANLSVVQSNRERNSNDKWTGQENDLLAVFICSSPADDAVAPRRRIRLATREWAWPPVGETKELGASLGQLAAPLGSSSAPLESESEIDSLAPSRAN